MNRSLAVLLLATAGGLVQAIAADGDVVFRSDVSLVRVDAQVVDRDNRPITGLHMDDFILREDGKLLPIRNFASENLPIDLLFLLDVSASMRPHVERIADASRQALRVLRDEDRVAIMVFDRYTRLRMPFRGNRQEVQREFESLLRQENFRGGTDITRGMLDAADYVSVNARRDARRAIVILTDDQTERDRDEDGVSRSLARADTVLSALIAPDAMRNRSMGSGRPPQSGGGLGGPLGGIILGRPRGPYGGRQGGNGVPHTHSAGTSEIARRSGGDSMRVDDAYALDDTLTRIRQRYALFFNLPAGARPGEERSVSLALNDAALRRYPSADLRYRRVYYVPSGARPATGTDPGQPTIISNGNTTGSPASSRRAGVSQPDYTHDGPLLDSPGAPPAPPAPSAPPATAKAPAPAAAPAPATPADPNAAGTTAQPADKPGGWRRVKPGEQP